MHSPEQGVDYQTSEHFPDSCGRHHPGNYKIKSINSKTQSGQFRLTATTTPLLQSQDKHTNGTTWVFQLGVTKREEGRGGGEETHNKMADTSTTTKNTANQESYDPIPGPWSVRRKNWDYNLCHSTRPFKNNVKIALITSSCWSFFPYIHSAKTQWLVQTGQWSEGNG